MGWRGPPGRPGPYVSDITSSVSAEWNPEFGGIPPNLHFGYVVMW